MASQIVNDTDQNEKDSVKVRHSLNLNKSEIESIEDEDSHLLEDQKA